MKVGGREARSEGCMGQRAMQVFVEQSKAPRNIQYVQGTHGTQFSPDVV